MTRPRVAVFALLVAACGDRGATSDAKITLRYHPPAGAVYRYALEQHHTMNMESGPLAGMGAQQVTLRMHFTQAVTGPVAGGIEVHLTFDSTQMELPGVPPQMIAAQLERTRGLHSTVLFDERLQIVRTDGPAPDLSPELAAQMGAGVKAVAMALPEQPVGRGDSWTVATDLPLGQLPGIAGESASRTTLTVREIRVAAEDTTVLLGVEVTFPGTPVQIDVQGQKATVRLTGGLSGDQLFSLTRGAVVGGTLKGTMRMNVTGGPLGRQGMTLSSATESTLRLSP
ncbi:MAG TPA: hypothetical protein VGQ06_16040 [Gemmatimonadales bacterium]|jgi:hypothetical protein|nr:hypothetical protein [Gemmatimonadales bacterium]